MKVTHMTSYTIKRNRPSEPANRTNGWAVVSLVFGILSFVLLPFIGGLIAVITGHVGRSQIRRFRQGGGGIALSGLILGYINLFILILGILAALALPAYADYISRVKTTEAVSQLANTREELAEQILAAPEQVGQINRSPLPAPEPYWQNVWIENGVLYARFATHREVAEPVQGSVLVMQPQAVNGQVYWHCSLPDLGERGQRYLPADLCANK